MIKIYLILLGILLLRIVWYFGNLPQRDIGETTVSGILVREPSISKGTYMLEVEGFRAYVPIEQIYHYGDYLIINGTFNGRYIEKPVVKRIYQSKGNPYNPNIFESLRNKVEKVYFSILPTRQAEILSGMVLGAENMSEDLENDMANAGLIHLVVASGMNLTLLGGFLYALFTNLHFGKRETVICSSLAVIFYAMLTGFQPPIVRALIMFEAVALGGLVGRKTGGLFALIAAGYLMLWVNPALVISFSFLLSFASMIGQIFVSTIKTSLPSLIDAIVLVVLQNFFAILFTAPIILIGFSRFSLISIISNLLVVWMIEPLMVIGGVAGIVGVLGFMSLSRFLLTPISFLLDYFLYIVKVFGEDEKFVWTIEGVTVYMAIGYYLLLFSILHYVNIAPWQSKK